MTTRSLLLLAFALLAGSGPARSASDAGAFDRTHAAYTALLRRYVSDGLVDYASLKQRDGDLEAYLTSLRAVSRDELMAWPEADRIAFWINAYNAFTMRLVLDHYPLKSIRSIGLLPLSAFRTEFIRLPAAGPGDVSLDHLEHRILRGQFHEPRVHFALVCASRGCPQLRREAYRGADLDRQLAEATRAFLADRERNRFDPATRTLHLSAIFKWFGEDFERSSGSVLAFVASYAPAEVAKGLATGVVNVEYEPYDWSLNAR